MMILIRALIFSLGLTLVVVTLLSAVKTFVLPRGAPDILTRLLFNFMRSAFRLRLRWTRAYEKRDRVMALFAPLILLSLLPIWLILVWFGFSGMYWAVGNLTWQESLRISGSSLLTLGYETGGTIQFSFFEFTEATLGLMLVALLIAYLPTIYNAFSRRESAVTLLEVRAGNPPSAVEMLLRFNRIHGWQRLGQHWENWEAWFADLEESHTSLSALVYFRSPQPEHSWISAAGAILDAASLTLAAIDIPDDPQAALCIRAGYLALRRIADYFNISYNPDPHFPNDSISVTRSQFEGALDELAKNGVLLKNDREQAWQDFAGWRVNYDRVLLALADLVMAPDSPWTGPRNYA